VLMLQVALPRSEKVYRSASLGLMVPLAGGAAPRLIADVNQQPEGIGACPTEMVAVGGRVFFTGEDRVFGREL